MSARSCITHTVPSSPPAAVTRPPDYLASGPGLISTYLFTIYRHTPNIYLSIYSLTPHTGRELREMLYRVYGTVIACREIMTILVWNPAIRPGTYQIKHWLLTKRFVSRIIMIAANQLCNAEDFKSYHPICVQFSTVFVTLCLYQILKYATSSWSLHIYWGPHQTNSHTGVNVLELLNIWQAILLMLSFRVQSN